MSTNDDINIICNKLEKIQVYECNINSLCNTLQTVHIHSIPKFIYPKIKKKKIKTIQSKLFTQCELNGMKHTLVGQIINNMYST